MAGNKTVYELTKATNKDIGKQIDTVTPQIANGQSPGLISKRFEKKDLDELKGVYKTSSMKKTGVSELGSGAAASPWDVSETCYTGANYRDARYTTLGRKALRVASINVKMRALFTRGVILHAIEEGRKAK